jgi:uncharacterized Fe-S cluster protein YjdI
MKQKPWIDADGAAIEEIVATIRKCPSARSAIQSTAPSIATWRANRRSA